MGTVSDFTAIDIDGTQQALSQYAGKVVAGRQHRHRNAVSPRSTRPESSAGLQRRGLVVLGFPCDQFGHQEPGNEDEIAEFCSAQLRRRLPDVRQGRRQRQRRPPAVQVAQEREERHPRLSAIKWNFTKFLVGRDGKVLERYAPSDTPESIAVDIEAALA